MLLSKSIYIIGFGILKLWIELEKAKYPYILNSYKC